MTLQVIGIFGFSLYVINYFLLIMHVISGNSAVYFLLNFLAASFVLLGLMDKFNLASAMIQVFWIGLSILGLLMRGRKDRDGRSEPA